MRAYLDTSAMIALHEPRDSNHKRAVSALKTIVERRASLTTGWHTIIEFGDGLARHYDQPTALTQIQRILSSRIIQVEPSEMHIPDALAILKARPDWGIDPSDAITCALMRSREMRSVFSYDADFVKMGFDLIQE